MVQNRYHAALEGSDSWQYANNHTTNDHSTRHYIVYGNYNEGGTSGTRPHSIKGRGLWGDWNKKHKWMFTVACTVIITAIVVLCVLLSRKHASEVADIPAVISPPHTLFPLTDTLPRYPHHPQLRTLPPLRQSLPSPAQHLGQTNSRLPLPPQHSRHSSATSTTAQPAPPTHSAVPRTTARWRRKPTPSITRCLLPQHAARPRNGAVPAGRATTTMIAWTHGSARVQGVKRRAAGRVRRLRGRNVSLHEARRAATFDGTGLVVVCYVRIMYISCAIYVLEAIMQKR